MRPHLMPIVSYHCNRALHSQTAGLLLFPRVFKSGPAPPRAFFCPRFLPIKMEKLSYCLGFFLDYYWVFTSQRGALKQLLLWFGFTNVSQLN